MMNRKDGGGGFVRGLEWRTINKTLDRPVFESNSYGLHRSTSLRTRRQGLHIDLGPFVRAIAPAWSGSVAHSLTRLGIPA